MANAQAPPPWQNHAPVRVPWYMFATSESRRLQAERALDEAKSRQADLEAENAELRWCLNNAETAAANLDRELTLARHAYFGVLAAAAPVPVPQPSSCTCPECTRPAADNKNSDAPPADLETPVAATVPKPPETVLVPEAPVPVALSASPPADPVIPPLPEEPTAPVGQWRTVASKRSPVTDEEFPPLPGVPRENKGKSATTHKAVAELVAEQEEEAMEPKEPEPEPEQHAGDLDEAAPEPETTATRDAPLPKRRVVVRAGASTSRSRRKRTTPAKRSVPLPPEPAKSRDEAPAPKPPATPGEKRRAKRREQRLEARRARPPPPPVPPEPNPQTISANVKFFADPNGVVSRTAECKMHDAGPPGSVCRRDLLWCSLFYAHSSVIQSADAFVQALSRVIARYDGGGDREIGHMFCHFLGLAREAEIAVARLSSGDGWQPYTSLPVETTCLVDWSHADSDPPLRSLYVDLVHGICNDSFVVGITAHAPSDAQSLPEKRMLELKRARRSLITACRSADEALESCHALLGCLKCVSGQRLVLQQAMPIRPETAKLRSPLFAYLFAQVRDKTALAHAGMQRFVASRALVPVEAKGEESTSVAASEQKTLINGS